MCGVWCSRTRKGATGHAARSGGVGRGVARRSTALAVAALLVGGSAASAATGFRFSALYTGRTCKGSTGLKGTTCVFRFRASRDGLTLRFVGDTVVSSWICKRGGGEALIGGEHYGAEPVPVLHVKSNGAIYGSARSGTKKTITVEGQLAGNGRTATITFHLANPSCASPKVTLTVQ